MLPLQRSVIAVPPLARRADGTLDREQNGRVLAHLRAGGVTSFLYGGNANLYHLPPSEFPLLAEMLVSLTAPDDWMVPAVGSDYGKALDEVRVLRRFPFSTAMVLPHRSPLSSAGYATGVRRLADAYGKPLVAYVKDFGTIEARDIARLVDDGAVAAVKYAIVRRDPAVDPYLEELLSLVDPALVISGIGERPVIDHWTRFGLRAFTSGSVCIAPVLSNAIREALGRGDVAEATRVRAAFMPLEDLRDAYSPIVVLHEAVRLAGIAQTGPLLPYLENLRDASILADVELAARDVRALNDDALRVVTSEQQTAVR